MGRRSGPASSRPGHRGAFPDSGAGPPCHLSPPRLPTRGGPGRPRRRRRRLPRPGCWGQARSPWDAPLSSDFFRRRRGGEREVRRGGSAMEGAAPRPRLLARGRLRVARPRSAPGRGGGAAHRPRGSGPARLCLPAPRITSAGRGRPGWRGARGGAGAGRPSPARPLARK